VGLIILIASVVSKQNNNAARSANERALDAIASFHRDAGVIGGTKKSAIAFDYTSQRIAIAHGGKIISLIGFRQIVSAESIDGASVASVNRGSQLAGAAIGGALLGPAGLLLGGLSGSSTSKQKMKRLALKIYTTDIQKPVVEAVFLDLDVMIPIGCPGYMAAYKPLDECLGRIKAILHEGARN
jgi:hypothetical protein